jgi:hypothetical protein
MRYSYEPEVKKINSITIITLNSYIIAIEA